MPTELRRVWAMPNSETFQCLPIEAFVHKYINGADVVVDPFARNSKLAQWSNDINPETDAEFHMDALDFLGMLLEKKVPADVVLLDPPYSLRQMKECYESFGRKVSYRESTYFYGDLRDAVNKILKSDGVVLSFGWNSIGMGKTRGFEILEVLLVCHGRAHNDTICVADHRNQKPLDGFTK